MSVLLSQVVDELGLYPPLMADAYFNAFRVGDPHSVFQVSPPQRRITSACCIIALFSQEGASAVLSAAFVLLKIDFKQLLFCFPLLVLVHVKTMSHALSLQWHIKSGRTLKL